MLVGIDCVALRRIPRMPTCPVRLPAAVQGLPPCSLTFVAVESHTVLAAGVLGSSAAEPPAAKEPAAKTEPAKRISSDTSHVVGSPDGPPPYRVVRTFPKLKVDTPIAVAHQPGSDRLIIIHQAESLDRGRPSPALGCQR